MDEGSHTALMMPPWTNDQSWTHESLGTIHSLLMPTNESYFPVEERKKKKRLPKAKIGFYIFFLTHIHMKILKRLVLGPGRKRCFLFVYLFKIPTELLMQEAESAGRRGEGQVVTLMQRAQKAHPQILPPEIKPML